MAEKISTLFLEDNNRYRPNNESNTVNKDWKDLLDYFSRPKLKVSDEEASKLMVFPADCLSGQKNAPSLIETIDVIINDEEYIRIKTDNLMGFVGIRTKKGRKQLKIKSRFDNNEGDYFLQYMLQKTYHFSIFNNLDFSRDSNIQAFDWLMLIFPYYLEKAFSQGLFRTYQSFSYNDPNIRGVVDVGQFIKKNIPFQGKISYRTRELSRDNAVTELVRHTIEFIATKRIGKEILKSSSIKDAVTSIRNYTPTYNQNDRLSVIQQNLNPIVHPYYNSYQDLQSLCLRILRYEGIGYGNNETDSAYGIIFDGALLWESYVATIIQDIFQHFTKDNSDFKLFQDVTKSHSLNEGFQTIIL